MKQLNKVIVAINLFFWPLNLYLVNTVPDFIKSISPGLLLFICYWLFRAKNKFYIFPSLLIPFIEPKLSLLPLFWGILSRIFSKNRKINKFTISFLFFSLVIIFVNWNGFRGQTVFTQDYEAEQSVIDKSNLYPSIFLSRVFQNKPRIYLNKVSDNFFALTDPNNYFFGFHPREIVINNQNIKKFPFFSLLFGIFGVYYFGKNKNKDFVLNIFLASLFSLVILKVFDRTDVILWLPLFLVVVSGMDFFDKTTALRKIVYALFFLFTIPQIMRIFLGFS